MLERLVQSLLKAAVGLMLAGVLYLALRGGIYLISYHTTLTICLAALAASFYASTKCRFGKKAAKWLAETTIKIFVWLVEWIIGLSIIGVGAGLIVGTVYAIIRYPLIVTALAGVSAVVILLMIYQKQRQT